MSVFSVVFSWLFTASLLLNGVFFLKLRRIQKEPPKSYELKQFLSDLGRGEALVRVSRVDPADFMLRSPREL